MKKYLPNICYAIVLASFIAYGLWSMAGVLGVDTIELIQDIPAILSN